MTTADGGGSSTAVHAVTLADIARAAGTSASTASRAINGKGYVSADAKQRLLEAADRLGYVPNASARTLKQRTSRVVGVVVSDLRNQFYGRVAAAIEHTLREDDYQMVLVPRRNMPYDVAASAWSRDPEPNGTGRLLLCKRMTPEIFDALRTFRDEHRSNGPEAIP